MAYLLSRSARSLQRSLTGAQRLESSTKILTAAAGRLNSDDVGKRFVTTKVTTKPPVHIFIRSLAGDPSSKQSKQQTGPDAGKSFVETEIKKYPVVIFAVKDCNNCKNAKAVLNKYKLTEKTYAIHDIDNHQNKKDIVGYLEKNTGKATLPRIFVNGKCIGGYEEVRRLDETGELGKMFQKFNPRGDAPA